MGADLARNRATREGHTVAVYNRSPGRTRTLIEQHPEASFEASESIAQLNCGMAA
jgi:6-phosphogluconate dehydrogenase